MKTNKRVLSALLTSLVLGVAAPVQAQQFSNVIVFGDSLSDAGYYNAWLASIGVPAALLPILGRFTTAPGPIWAEILAQHHGYTLRPSNVAGGFDFAQGGARVTSNSSSTPPGQAQRSVTTQFTELMTRTGGTLDPNALYLVWAGANDVIQILGGAQAGTIPADQVSTAVTNAAGAEILLIASMSQAGARNIVVFTLPNIGATPGLMSLGPTAAATATQLSAGFNTALTAGLAQTRIPVMVVDAFSFFTEVRANPAGFGFSNITTPACRPFPPFSSAPDALFCPPPFVAPDANRTFLFADGIHPTAGGHAVIAQFVEAMISGPTQYSLLAEAPLSTRAGHMRALTDGLTTARHEGVGKWSVFVAGDRSDYDIDPSTGFPAVKSRSRNIAVGLTGRLSESVTMGVSIGKGNVDGTFNSNFGTFGDNPGGFSAQEDVISLFGAMGWRGFYGTAVASVGDLRFNDVRRNVNLGPMVRTSNTKTGGSNASAYVTAGYDFAFGALQVGPTVSVALQNIEVNGFDEIGMASSNLRISSQSRKSEIWSAGIRVSGKLGSWTPWIRLTADKERRDDARFVTATPVSIVQGAIPYNTPAYQPDTTFMTGSVGVRGTIMERVGVSFAYYKVTGRSGSQDDGLSGMVSVRF